MFGGTQGNNTQQQSSVNTKIKTMFGDTSCMQLDYWDDKLAIRLNPTTGVTPEGLRQYDFKRKISTALTVEKAEALTKEIIAKILPLINDVSEGKALEKDTSIALSVGNKGNLFMVEYKKDLTGVPQLHATLQTMNTDTKTIEVSYTYKFTKTSIIVDYDANTGTGTEKHIEEEFNIFFGILSNLKNIIASISEKQHVSQMAIPKTYAPKAMNNNQQNSYQAPVTTFPDGDSGLPF